MATKHWIEVVGIGNWGYQVILLNYRNNSSIRFYKDIELFRNSTNIVVL